MLLDVERTGAEKTIRDKLKALTFIVCAQSRDADTSAKV